VFPIFPLRHQGDEIAARQLWALKQHCTGKLAHHRRLRDVSADEGLRLICWPAGRFAAEQNEKAAGNMVDGLPGSK
jgi:hypothetical protein